MTDFLYGLFDRLLSDPLNKRICNWGLAIGSALFFGNIIIQLLIQKS